MILSMDLKRNTDSIRIHTGSFYFRPYGCRRRTSSVNGSVYFPDQPYQRRAVCRYKLIIQGAGYLEIALTTFVINIRYMLMSLSLSQKIDPKITLWQRLVFGFGITDETFSVAQWKKEGCLISICWANRRTNFRLEFRNGFRCLHQFALPNP